MHRAAVVLAAALGVMTVGAEAQAPSGQALPTQLPTLETLLTRVGERIAEYYKRAQNVVCIEKNTVQPVGHDYAPLGFARITEYQLHVESETTEDGEQLAEAKVVRELLRVNGKVPRDKDKMDRAGCTDANPLSTEPLTFLLPIHRSEYTFVSGGAGKGRDRNTFIIEFTSSKPEGKGQLEEDPRGHPDCFSWSLPVVMKGRVFVDATSFDVVRVEQRLGSMADLSVPIKLQRSHNFSNSVVVERHDTVTRYRTVGFHDPDEAMLLPESIETLIVVHGGLESIRTRQVFADYRRFMTGARLVK